MGSYKDLCALCDSAGTIIADDFTSTALAKELLGGFFLNLAVLYLGREQCADKLLVKFL